MEASATPLFINYNGKFHPAASGVIPVTNRAFRYGDALFESIRIAGGRPQLLTAHTNRLLSGLGVLHMNVPDNFNEEFISAHITELAEKNGVQDSARVRFTVMRSDLPAGQSGSVRYTPVSNDISYVVECEPMVDTGYTLNKTGYHIGIYDDQRKSINRLSSLKSANCLLYTLAGIHMSSQGWDRVILLNELGNMAEENSSNIFLAFNGVVYTPALTQGCLPGVMRQAVIELAREAKLEVQECPLSPEVLFKADEVFLTNAISGVSWVGAFRHKRYYNKMARLFNDHLNAKLRTDSVTELREPGE